MAQLSKRSPPTNVARVRFLGPDVMWVELLFLASLREFFSRFSPSAMINTSNSNSIWKTEDEEPLIVTVTVTVTVTVIVIVIVIVIYY